VDAVAVIAAFVAGLAAAAWLLRARVRAPEGGAAATVHAREGRLDARLDTLSAELGKVTDLVRMLERDRERQYGALTEQIAAAGARAAELSDTTQVLREALASGKARGQWGERLAEDVLQAAGFTEGVSYRKQRAVAGGGIPDFAFLLPEGREVRMDVKFPLDNYLRYVRAAGDPERDQARSAFLRDARGHVRALARRDYLDPDVTVDCLLLFIPNEQVYGFLHETDPSLLDDALRQKVVLCSPMTLFAVLAVIRQAVDVFQLARTGDEILSALGGFAKQWGAFTDQLDKLGTHLDRAHGAFEAVATTRRRQLERQLEQVEDLRSARGLDAALDRPLRALRADREAG
jgi:DNA recombination protein RmuC